MGDVLPAVKAQEADPGYGIVIASAEPGDPAADAGVVRGDILLEIDGEALEHSGDLVSYLDKLEPGDEVELKVLPPSWAMHGLGSSMVAAGFWRIRELTRREILS